jgi:hypothetical protein
VSSRSPTATSRPIPAYWSAIDTFFQTAAKYGISVFAIPVDAYASSVFGSMTTAQAQAFGRFLADRYPPSAYPGIVWMLGNDGNGEGGGSGNSWPSPSFYSSLLAGLESNGARLSTVENWFYESLSTDGGFGKTVSVNASYSYHPAYEGILNGRAAKDEPVFYVEGAYENSTVDGDSTPLDLRMQLGWYMTSGASGGFYGNDSLWMYNAGWQNLLDTTIVAQRHVFNSVFAGLNWSALQPDTSSRLATSGRGTQFTNGSPTGLPGIFGNEYVTAAYTADGTLGVIYNPNTADNHITVSSAVLAANPTIVAVDPTNGARTNLGWTTTPTMGANAAGDHDWLFIITAGQTIPVAAGPASQARN